MYVYTYLANKADSDSCSTDKLASPCSYSSSPTGGRTAGWALFSVSGTLLVLRKEEGAFPAQVNTSAIEDKLKTSRLKAARPKADSLLLLKPSSPAGSVRLHALLQRTRLSLSAGVLRQVSGHGVWGKCHLFHGGNVTNQEELTGEHIMLKDEF